MQAFASQALVPAMTGASTPAGFVISADSELNAGVAPAWKALNKSNVDQWDGWHSAAGIGGYNAIHWLKVKLDKPKILDGIMLMNRVNTGVPQAPQDFLIQGSTDGTSWTTLGSVTNADYHPNTTTNYPVSNTTAYQYYRVYITKNYSPNGGYVFISELQLFGSDPQTPTPTATTTPAPTQTATPMPNQTPTPVPTPTPTPTPIINRPTATAKDGNGLVMLTWTSITNATNYRIYRDGFLLTTVGGDTTTMTDTQVTNDRSYTYEVSAVVGGIEGTKSNPVKAMPNKGIDLSGIGGGSGGGGGQSVVNPNDAIGTGKSFADTYLTWILLIVGLIFSPKLVSFVLWLAKGARAKDLEKDSNEADNLATRERKERPGRVVSNREWKELKPDRMPRQVLAWDNNRQERPDRTERRGRDGL